jgi:hypothetical protein
MSLNLNLWAGDTQQARMTYTEMVAAEPCLRDLMAEAACANAACADRGERYCQFHAYAIGYGGEPGFKARLCQLVGWSSPHRGTYLATCDAYDVALQRLVQVLPACDPGCPCAG